LKKNSANESFDDIFSKIRQNQYPFWVRRTFAKVRRRKYDAMVFFKGDLRPLYEEIYGSNRFFDVVADETFGHKVIIHGYLLYNMYGNRRTGKITKYNFMLYLMV